MEAQTKQVLSSLGLADDKILELENLPADKLADFKPDDLVGLITTGVKTKVLNDPTFYDTLTADKLPEAVRKKMETGQYENFINELSTVAVKKLGLVEGEDFTKDDARKASLMFEKAAKAYLGKNATNKDLVKIQSDLQEALTQKTELETSLPTKILEAVNKEKLTSGSVIEKLAGMHKLSLVEGMKVKPSLIIDSIMSKMKGQATITFDPETMEFAVMQKDHPTLALLKDGKAVTFDALLQSILEAEKLIDKETAEEVAAREKKRIQIDAGGTSEIPQYIKDKMK